MPGKRQKPAGELKGYGSRHTGEAPLVLVAPDIRRAVPECPPSLPQALRPVWDAFWADPVSQMVTSADGYDVGRYFTLLAERERHERAISRKPLVAGSMGQQVANPRLAIVKELTREIEKVREHLGVLPLARQRLGIARVTHEAGVADLRHRLRQGGGRVNPGDTPPVIDLDELG